MGQKKKPNGKVGAPSLFVPEIRQTIINNLTAGSTIRDSCAMAGIGESTYHSWIAIAQACVDDSDYEGKPSDPYDRRAFVEFLEATQKARAAQRLRAVTTIIRAGVERWVHVLTGAVRTSPPPPITWLNTKTGELVFADPADTGLGDPDDYKREWSGDAWRYDGGAWQSLAWYLERTAPNEFGRTVQDINVNDLRNLTDEQLEKLAKTGKL